ncbi:type II secretion system minor pseudopilin GspI [Croceicoccus mobilis]|uniref:Type II secretion system protein I n=1 Tax=Croceicoccus mobilis TaxID=1703339 RepID=A0A916Z2I7_9SPHN|nr:type II secretion system minor pseudopilin GspI [Croceicoccus mobilis]GGD73020.1 type II secretion system protein GspI [Croceicoccus mobilis]
MERKAANGFTLIEMLVALAIFALAALALLRMEGAAISRTADLDQRVALEVTAQNLAAEWMSDPAAPALGEDSGIVQNAGRNFAWTRIVDRPEELSGATRILLSVRQADGQGSAVSFEILRAAP